MLAPSAARTGRTEASLRSRASFHSTARAAMTSSSGLYARHGRPRFQRASARLEVCVMEADIGHPGGVAGVVGHGDEAAADVDAVGELHAQLERPQPQVHA